MLIKYLIVTYGKISPITPIDIKQNQKPIQYNPQTSIDTVSNQVRDLLEYRELYIYPYNQIQTTNTAYKVINRKSKFQDSIETWDWMTTIKIGYILIPIFANPTVRSKKSEKGF